MSENLLPHPLSPSRIRSYINFDGTNGTPDGDSSQATLQSRGVAALWQLLQDKSFAYLGDEVGMGKTRQAMGVIATQFLSDPNSHVVIVCPGVTLQKQWESEWDAFIRSCYRAKDNRLTSALDGGGLQRLDLHDRLRDFARSLLLNESRIHLLRYSSFSRPIWFGESEPGKRGIEEVNAVIETYRNCLREIGISKPSIEEEGIFERFVSPKEESWRLDMTTRLNRAYAKRVGQLLDARDIDLVVFDEAQYLRNLDNYQNSNIRLVFRSHVKKWLFMSATPLHTGKKDISSLDSYLCLHESGNDSAKKCLACGNPKCTQAGHRLKKNIEVVDILKEFLVRRNRSYQDADLNLYGKVEYRRYDRSRIAASEDPFAALTMALVQKRLVTALVGKNNCFRQGECSSFESLSSSLRNSRRIDRDGVSVECKEFEQKGDGNEKQEETPDRSFIDELNQSFRQAMLDEKVARDASAQMVYNMPHAKLNEAADRIFRLNLQNGSNRKSLVFVRRLDTVDELMALLLWQFQEEVDARLELWRGFLAQGESGLALREKIWNRGEFWTWSRDAEDDLADDDDISTEVGSQEDDGENPANLGRAGDLPYFAALKQYKGKSRENGMLTSFQKRLLVTGKISSNPLRGFLLATPSSGDTSGKEACESSLKTDVWQNADKCWRRFLELILDKDQAVLSAEGSPYRWLFVEPDSGEEFWKISTLKRCIFQSFRQSDFIVDLYVMNRFLKKVDSGRSDASLQDKLLWLFGDDRGTGFPEGLESYISNWKGKIRHWLEHFDLIVDKCLRSNDANTWELLCKKVDGAFARMAPVFGRSGRLQDRNAVTQFKFPTHPNVLVCTDVLKEGVDLHLFCDDVIHYGVAWTSGDLEQRIGRVDRFGSLISRKIGMHGKSVNLPASLPRLNVEFPYLDGTLDKHQVERVITAKIKNDLRMDLGKRSDELGVISVENLGTDNWSLEQEEKQLHSESSKFFQDPFPMDDDHAAQKALDTGCSVSTQCLPAHLEQVIASAGDGENSRHIPAIRSVVIRLPITKPLTETSLLRSYPGKVGRKKKVCHEEEVLIPIVNVGKADSPPEAWFAGSLVESLSASDTLAISSSTDIPGFSFSAEWNTLVSIVKIDSPFEGEAQRSQVVLLERVNGIWLLRTPMFKLGGLIAEGFIGSSQWIAEQNSKRNWGYLISDQGIIWFVAFVLEVKNAHAGDYLPVVAERVGKIGDRMQHLYVASDDPDDWGYRAKNAFPTMERFGNSSLNSLSNGGESIMGMETVDLISYGQFFSGLLNWFRSTFHDVLSQLYDEGSPEADWSLKISKLEVLPSGILYLTTNGAERFRLQAYLQLDKSGSNAASFPSPRMIWELAVSPKLMGPKPSLELSPWDDLPHANPSEWDGELNEYCGVYTHKGEKYRYLTVYHDPRSWEASGKKLMKAWGSIVPGMQGDNFMKKWCRDLFMGALSPIKP